MPANQTYNDVGVKNQRVEVRSHEFSNWHRETGEDNKAYDIDLIEVDRFKFPLAVYEIKYHNEPFDEGQKEFVCNAANMWKVPAFVIRHNAKCTSFDVTPINNFAYEWIKKNKEFLNSISASENYIILNSVTAGKFVSRIHGNVQTKKEADNLRKYQSTEE